MAQNLNPVTPFGDTIDVTPFDYEYLPPSVLPGQNALPSRCSSADHPSSWNCISECNRVGSFGFGESRLSCVHVCDYTNMCPMPNIQAAHVECRKRRIISGGLSASCARLTPHVFGCGPPIRQLTLHDSSNGTIKADVIPSLWEQQPRHNRLWEKAEFGLRVF